MASSTGFPSVTQLIQSAIKSPGSNVKRFISRLTGGKSVPLYDSMSDQSVENSIQWG